MFIPKISIFFTTLLACLYAFEDSDAQLEEVSIRFISYNVSRIFLKEKIYNEVYKASSKQLTQAPDILVLVFQERLGIPRQWISGSTENNFIFGRKPEVPIEGYKLLIIKDDLQTETAVYIKSDKSKQLSITNIEVDSTIDRNIQYLLSSKGALSITFTINSVLRVQVLGTHLHAFLGGVRQRKVLLNKINKELIAVNPVHYRFMVGDLNYRIDKNSPHLMNASEKEIDKHYMPYEYNEKLSKKNVEWFFTKYPELKKIKPSSTAGSEQYKILKQYDQLRMVIHSGYSLPGFKESNIGFQATYKVYKHKDAYKTERTISWTDRFIWRAASSNLEEYLEHGSYEVMKENPIATDHLPIVKELKVKLAPFKKTSLNIHKLSESTDKAQITIEINKGGKQRLGDMVTELNKRYSKKPNMVMHVAIKGSKGWNVQRQKIEKLDETIKLTVGAETLTTGLKNIFGLLTMEVCVEFYIDKEWIMTKTIGKADIFLDENFVNGLKAVKSLVLSEEGKSNATLKAKLERECCR